MIDYNELNDFIIKVFNYYNGRINVINKAVLDINWANLMGSSFGGFSRLPNIVSINIMTITRFYDNINYIKFGIIETIIHELHHTDQLINYPLYMSDMNYNKFIEYACEVQTTIYIAGHIQEIHDVFGVNVSVNSNVYDRCMANWDLQGVKYQRRYYHDHIYMCIDEIINLNKEDGMKLYQKINNEINLKNSMYLSINDDTIKICSDNELIPIEQFNNFIINYMSTGFYYDSTMEVFKNNSIMYIDIKTTTKEIMCKKI